MKLTTRNIVLSIISIAAILFLTSFASALVFSSGPTNSHPLNALTPNNNNVSLILTNNENATQNIVLSIDSISSPTGSVSFTLDPQQFTLAPGATKQITLKATFTGNFEFGPHSTTLVAKGDATNSSVATAAIQHFSSFCRSGPIRHDILEIKDVKINNLGAGGDDEEWLPFDEIEVIVEVENTGDDNKAEDELEDIVVQIGLLDSDGRNIISKFEFEDEEEEDIGNLDPDDDEEQVTFNFILDEIDEDVRGNHDLVVKVFEDGREDSVCVDFSNDLSDKNGFSEVVDIDRETDEGKFIQFINTIIEPTRATCGDIATLSTEVVNVGSDDQEQVRVNLFNRDIGLQLENIIRSDLDEGDREKINFEFKVPQDLEDGTYSFDLSADYDYDEDDDEYDESTDDAERILLTLFGCSVTPPSDGETRIASIAASLDSDAKAGQELTISAIVTNLKSDSGSFIVSASGYESWAELDSISSRILNLNPGETEEITLSFNVDEDVTGAQSFMLEVREGDKLETREIQVNIEGSAAPTTPQFDFGDNSLLWIIGIINVILIILIIVVAVRISRR